MTARKKKTEQKQNIKVGDMVEYNGKQYKVVYAFGSKDQYMAIEDQDNRFSVKTGALKKITATEAQE